MMTARRGSATYAQLVVARCPQSDCRSRGLVWFTGQDVIDAAPHALSAERAAQLVEDMPSELEHADVWVCPRCTGFGVVITD